MGHETDCGGGGLGGSVPWRVWGVSSWIWGTILRMVTAFGEEHQSSHRGRDSC